LEVRKEETRSHRRIAAERGHPQAIGVFRSQFPARPIFSFQPLGWHKLEIKHWKLEKEGNQIAHRRIAAERGHPQAIGVSRFQFPAGPTFNLQSLISKLLSPSFNFRPSDFNF
jgi:hypothetical protein